MRLTHADSISCGVAEMSMKFWNLEIWNTLSLRPKRGMSKSSATSPDSRSAVGSGPESLRQTPNKIWLRNVEDIPGYTWLYLDYQGCHRHPILPEIRAASRVVRPRAANAALVGAKTVYGPWCRLVLRGAVCHSWSGATGIHWPWDLTIH